MSNRSYSPGILIDKTCPSFSGATPATVYLPSGYSLSDPLFRCFCPCPDCSGSVFSPSTLGNLCTRLASASNGFVRDGTVADYVIDPFTGLSVLFNLHFSIPLDQWFPLL